MASLPGEISVDGLILRKWSAAAIPSVTEAISTSLPELQKWLPWADHAPNLQQVEQRVEFFATAFDADEEWHYLLWEDNEVVDTVGLTRPEFPEVAVIGYWVRSDRTGHGYATNAASAVTDAAFECLEKVQRVEIHMDAANRASAAIPPKIGYSLDREVPREIVTGGHTGVGYVWAIDRARWRAKSARNVAGRRRRSPSPPLR